MSLVPATLELISSRPARLALAAGLLAAVGVWAANLQFGVQEIRRADAPVNFPLALSQPSPADWPGLFGPQGNGHAGWDGSLFSTSGNGRWQIALPGDGIGGPSVWRDSVFVPVIDAGQATASLWACDRRDGRVLWKRCLHRQLSLQPDSLRHVPGVAACDGQSVFLGVVVQHRLLVSAVGLDGELRWTRDVGPLPDADGRLISPRLFGPLLIVAADHPATSWDLGRPTSHLTALHRQQGEIIWRIRRRNSESAMPPVIADVAGQSQLVISGPGEVRAYDPATGDERWLYRLRGVESVPVVVSQHRQLFVATADPRPIVSAIRATDDAIFPETNVLWTDLAKAAVDLPPVCHRDSVFTLSRSGLLICLDAAKGKVRWQRQLPGTYRTLPLVGGDRMLCVNTQSAVFVLDLLERGQTVAEELPRDELSAPPTATSEQLFLRTQQGLVCIPWEKPAAPVVISPKDQPKRL